MSARRNREASFCAPQRHERAPQQGGQPSGRPSKIVELPSGIDKAIFGEASTAAIFLLSGLADPTPQRSSTHAEIDLVGLDMWEESLRDV